MRLFVIAAYIVSTIGAVIGILTSEGIETPLWGIVLWLIIIAMNTDREV